MAKHKGKAKSGVHAGSRNKIKGTKENPFEVRVNKRHYDILGRKMKHEKGKPGVSRSRGLKKRERTLLVEYKQRNKANLFVDKRFGEYDENLSLEEKMLKRFATEKQRHHERSGLFNLEDEELTHFGQSLGEIKHFDGPVLSDDEDEKDDIVSGGDRHFGGFLMKRKILDGGKADDEPRSKKEIMEEVVANAKIKKHERQMAKEETETMCQKVDEGFESIRSLLTFGAQPRPKADDYDIVVREMGFEMKAQATDKLKTEEQLAKVEEEKLQKLEFERIRRMKGLPCEKKKPTHISADDLLDCYAVDTDRRSLLSYKDGKMVVPNDYGENLDKYIEINYGNVREDGSPGEGEEEDNDDSGEDDDIESSSESSENEMDELQPAKNRPNKEKTRASSDGKTSPFSPLAVDELPYTFAAPESYEEFLGLLSNRSTSDMFKIVERIQKCNHPKLNPRNKVKMEILFDILIKYIDEVLSQATLELRTVDGLICHLFNLAQHSPLHTARTMQEKLKEIQKRFCESSRKRKIPDVQTLLYLRIISVLFPTSDFKHGVCTPALILTGQILSQITVQSVGDSFIGLFVCNLVYEFVETSKRYVPEVINYLTGILYLFSEKSEPIGKLFPPFKARSKYRNAFKVSSASSSEPKPVNLSKVFTNDLEDNDNTRNTALYTCLVVLKKFVVIYEDLVCFPEIFEPAVHHMNRILTSNYSPKTRDLHSDILEIITCHVTKRQPLALQTRRPMSIQMFEPKFDEHYEVKRKHSRGNKNVNERQKLRYKHKKEFKGALREIRKDSQFLARQQLQEQLQRDSERAQKTKEIQTMLSNQQGEANAFNRKKRKNRN